MPDVTCARVWAPDWAAEVYPVDELDDPDAEEAAAMRRELADLSAKHERLTRLADTLQLQLDACTLELEQLRRDAARRRLSDEDAARATEIYERERTRTETQKQERGRAPDDPTGRVLPFHIADDE